MTGQKQNGANQDVKRRTAKRKAPLVLDLIKETTAVAQDLRPYPCGDREDTASYRLRPLSLHP